MTEQALPARVVEKIRAFRECFQRWPGERRFVDEQVAEAALVAAIAAALAASEAKLIEMGALRDTLLALIDAVNGMAKNDYELSPLVIDRCREGWNLCAVLRPAEEKPR
jgi:hypothetical protein